MKLILDSVYAAVDMAFSVSDGKVYLDGVEAAALDIKVPVKSLTGKLLNNGNPLSGEISFERVLNGTTYFYTGKTDAAGNIALRVPDGTYTIKTVYGKLRMVRCSYNCYGCKWSNGAKPFDD